MSISLVSKPKNLLAVVLLALSLAGAFFVHGEEAGSTDPEVARLQAEIGVKNDQIKQLEAEANRLRSTIAETAQQAATLSSEIKRINQAIARLQAEIKVNQQKIQRTKLEIKSLGIQIQQNETDIDQKREHITELVRTLSRLDQEGVVSMLLKHDRFSDLYGDLQRIISLQEELTGAIADLRDTEERLSAQKTASEKKVKELEHYVSELADQRQVQATQQSERSRVLLDTKNQEKAYRDQLADNERKRKALEDEIIAFENKLNVSFDLGSLPRAVSGVLNWPVPKTSDGATQCGYTVWSFLTQCFGNTSFARAGGYNGKGHNGVDFRADVGTPIFAAESGTVRGTGDTDLGCRRASYGRWILIDHRNNLTTLYAHLSLIKVIPGQVVERGDLIGYAGRTGYATGPHLHLSVFAKAAVEIGELQSKVCGRIMVLPLAPLNGYLNPLNYL